MRAAGGRGDRALAHLTARELHGLGDAGDGAGHVLVVDIDAADQSVAVSARRVGRWRFVTLRRAVDTDRDIADLDLNLDGLPDKERTVVRLALTGSL
mgnify:CR=1 FL=1